MGRITVNTAKLLEKKQGEKEAELEGRFASLMQEGLVTSLGHKIKCATEDLGAWNLGQVEADSSGVVTIVRLYDGTLLRNITKSDYDIMHGEQIAHVQKWWTHKVLLQEMAKEASTLQDLESIDWDTTEITSW